MELDRTNPAFHHLPDTDHHHILFTRSDWESNKQARKLRRIPQLIPELDIATHIELHQNCPQVPLLGRFAVSKILEEFHPANTTYKTVDKLKICIDDASKCPKTHWIEKDLGQLVIYSLDVQMPYILDGEVHKK